MCNNLTVTRNGVKREVPFGRDLQSRTWPRADRCPVWTFSLLIRAGQPERPVSSRNVVMPTSVIAMSLQDFHTGEPASGRAAWHCKLIPRLRLYSRITGITIRHMVPLVFLNLAHVPLFYPRSQERWLHSAALWPFQDNFTSAHRASHRRREKSDEGGNKGWEWEN